MKTTKQMSDSYKIFGASFILFIVLAIASLFGCSQTINEPITTKIYQSVPYNDLITYDMKLELNESNGTLINEAGYFIVKGTMENNHLILTFNEGNLDLYLNETKACQLAGNCTYRGEQRAIRFMRVK